MSLLVKSVDVKGIAVHAGNSSAEAECAQYLTFLQGGEMFAIGILGIKEIIEYAKLTTVPLMPEFISGVINIRGAVVPVIDLSARFGREATVITRRSCIVIIETVNEEEKIDIGIIVDSVSEVLEIPPSDIEPAPHFGTNIRADFISGMGKINGEFVIILDISRVLSVNEMSSLTKTVGESMSDTNRLE
ncbi:chemotaxis protein CheW [Psychromonas antarctica]|uniref:chemotaxis protein CheW n=1 Tax=Psychromonas antarctica TaxID=67573 RepID=UPI001EE82909|nr:chemotaxis protein CheW [Psychromonas antarctica]MCG6202085.1 chemotaxis protein CheW [Psychromonas antarctica]